MTTGIILKLNICMSITMETTNVVLTKSIFFLRKGKHFSKKQTSHAGKTCGEYTGPYSRHVVWSLTTVRAALRSGTGGSGSEPSRIQKKETTAPPLSPLQERKQKRKTC